MMPGPWTMTDFVAVNVGVVAIYFAFRLAIWAIATLRKREDRQ